MCESAMFHVDHTETAAIRSGPSEKAKDRGLFALAVHDSFWPREGIGDGVVVVVPASDGFSGVRTELRGVEALR